MTHRRTCRDTIIAKRHHLKASCVLSQKFDGTPCVEVLCLSKASGFVSEGDMNDTQADAQTPSL